jgi:2-polyprenyl-6-methoxyphenol hydroxylase-like FAD-dependent oxidoreductase
MERDMSTSIPERVQVAVVGAGPTGLALACTLRQAGVEVLVMDKAAEGTNDSRAAVVHARTLEVLDGLDVTRRMLDEGLVVPVFTVRNRRRTLARIDFTGLPTRYPYTLMLPQSQTEAILAARLRELGGHVYRPYTATKVARTTDGATLTVTGPDQVAQSVQARYVVGADGMHSTIRQAADIGFTGGRYTQAFLLADVRMDWPLPPAEVQLFFSADGLVVVAPLPGGRHRIVATADPAPEKVDTAVVQFLLEHRGPGSVRVHDLAWGSQFQVHHRVADDYRRGPLLLAGDAAHVHSPAGGQGMNTGIQDAVDLGHALIDVLNNQRPDRSLDAYQERRRPIAQQIVTLTDRATRVATLTNPAAQIARNTAITLIGHLPAARRRLALQLAELMPTPQPARSGERPERGTSLSGHRGGPECEERESPLTPGRVAANAPSNRPHRHGPA